MIKIYPLTSLRFVFALLVFLHHLEPLNKFGDAAFRSFSAYWKEGHIGVSFFFVLSGFILSYVYQEKLLQKKLSVKEFWLRRIIRIYPLHLLTFLVMLLIVANITLIEPSIFTWQIISQLTLSQSFIPDSDFYFSFNSAAWSISDEFFFYMCFPALIGIVHKVGKRKTTGLFLLLTLCLVLAMLWMKNSARAHEWFYIYPLVRLMDFGLGILLYQWIGKQRILNFRSATILEFSASALLIFAYLFNDFVPEVFRYSVYYWLPCILLIGAFYYSGGLLSRLLSLRWFVYAGEVSFAFYLWHQVVITCLGVMNHLFKIIDSPFLLSIIYLFVSLVLSILTYIFIEKRLSIGLKNKVEDSEKMLELEANKY